MGDLENGLDGDGIQGKVKDGKIRHKSLKSRPGATKRKERLEKMEMERFGRNLAQLTAGSGKERENVNAMAVEDEGAQPRPGSTTSRWAALREFISQTMEQKEEFAMKG